VSFEWPLLLWTLLLVPVALACYVLVQRRRMRYAVRFTNLDLLANVVERSPGWRRHVPAALTLLALAALLTGMARPQAEVSVPREQATVVLAMDVSASMMAEDVEPSRLEAAQAAASSFVEDLPENFRVGVVAFSRGAYVVSPPTDDKELAQRALTSLETETGTAIGDGISASLDSGLLTGDGRGNAEGERPPLVVLLLSDGANTVGRDPLDAADEAHERRVPVYTVALGTPDGTVTVTDELGIPRTIRVPPAPGTLEAIADRTGGQFFDAPSEGELARVYDEIGSMVSFEKEKQEVTFAFVAGGAVLLLLGGALSALWFNRIP
jgi:Ca-activated chloride channel family protein